MVSSSEEVENVPFYADMTGNSLKGGQSRYPNIISKKEMLTITALCETFLPSLDVSSSTTTPKSIVDFYGTSAVMTRTDEELGGLLSGRLKHRALGLIRLVLWLLSTWWGTLAICGTRCLSNKFPYVQNFPAVGQEQRVKIVLSWSLSSFFLFRMLFKALKFTTMVLFFSQANENNQNPSWKTMGYCGPDPNHINPDRKTTRDFVDEKDGPLRDFVVDAAHEEELLARAFKQMGFSTTASTDSTCFTVNCDAVVVGSGTGGSVVAGKLAKAGHKVIVVEKGRYYSRRNLSLLEGPSLDQMYEGNGFLCTDDLSMLILAGSTVGGGSTINWSASIRTPEHVLNEWCDEHELKLFGSNAFHHALDAVCDRMGVQGEVTDEGFNNAILRKGCEELGYPVTTVGRNAPKDHNCGWCHLGCRDGRKKSVQETWLSDMVNSGNGVILQGCNVSRVLHRTKRGKSRNVAGGIVAEFGEKKKKQRIVISSIVTVVAGGALNTPALLKRSGLNNANIGKNLHLHPVVMAWGHFPETTDDLSNNEDKRSNTVIFPEKKSFEGGIITSMSTIDSSFKTSGYGAVIQTPALHPGVFSALMPWVSPLDFRHRMRKFSRTAHLFALARDRGSGSAPDYPNKLWYSLDPRDEEKLQKGIERMLRVLVAAGAAEIGTHNCEGKIFNVKKGSKEELEEFVKEASGKRLRDLSTPLCSAHQMGSCRMGTEISTSVVSPKCETWEVEGLFVADTSVFPTALGVNPMITVQAISFCTAQSILEVLNRKKI